jgi:iron complex transport system ATP-binding protein
MTRIAACGHGVEARYGDIVALSASDFTIPAGSFTALIGPNGSGKSTLLSVVAGLRAPTAGTVEVLGRSAEAARQRVAFVPQSTMVNDLLPVTVREVVGMGRYASLGLLGRAKRDDRDAIEEALGTLFLEGLADRHVRELSGGQRQRVFVAQGLAQERDMLLLDEPHTGLDIQSEAVISTVIEQERVSGRTVVVTTHDLAEASRADHVVLLSGRVVAEGPPEQVLTAEPLSEAYRAKIVEVDGRLVFDDPAHAASFVPHVHFDRASGTHQHD